MEMFDYRQARDHAMSLGLRSALMWIGSFLLFAYTIPSMLMEVAYLLGFASFIVVGLDVRRYRKAGNGMNIMRCWWMTWMTFMCCVLLTSAAQYVYFAFLDDGRFFGGIQHMLDMPEIKIAYEQAQVGNLLEQMQDAVEEMSKMSAKTLTISLTSSNLILGFFFSILSVLFCIGAKPTNYTYTK